MAKKDPIKRAIKLAGGFAAVGRAVGMKRQAVFQWPRCPAEHVLTLEKMSGISRHELRPDVFGPGRKGG